MRYFRRLTLEPGPQRRHRRRVPARADRRRAGSGSGPTLHRGASSGGSGCSGALLAVLTTIVVTVMLRWPSVVAAVGRGGLVLPARARVLTLRSQGLGLPGPDSWRVLVDEALFGWKDLLTTLPPVDGESRLLVAALAARPGHRAARRLVLSRGRAPAVRCSSRSLPLLPPLALLGAGDPARRDPARLAVAAGDGVRRAGPGLARPALRPRRRAHAQRPGQAGPAGRRCRAGRAWPGCWPCPWAPGRSATTRTGWSCAPTSTRRSTSGSTPPRSRRSGGTSSRRTVRSSRRTSTTRRCSRSRGCPPAAGCGSPCWTATTAWSGEPATTPSPGPTDDTLPAGLRRSSTTPSRARRSTPGSPSGPAGAGSGCPRSGALQTLRFDCRRPATRSRSPSATTWPPPPASSRTGLQPGDVYTFTAVSPRDALTPETVPSGNVGEAAERRGLPGHAGGAVVRGRAPADAPRARRRAAPQVRGQVLRRRRARARRSTTPATTGYRLTDDTGGVNSPFVVGNDEQYAAWMALLANRIGVPARVVFGAIVPDGGDGHRCRRARVGRAAGGRRDVATLPTELFMDDDRPAEQQTARQQPLSGSVVPPPAPIPPPSTAGEQNDADMKVRKNKSTAKQAAEEDAAGPVAQWVGRAVALRRRPAARARASCCRRSSWPSCCAAADAVPGRKVSARFVGAWRELRRPRPRPRPAGADRARGDPARAVPPRSSARAPGRWPIAADSHVFGPRLPRPRDAEAYWHDVDRRARGDVGRGRAGSSGSAPP